jgi:hypothetical protein
MNRSFKEIALFTPTGTNPARDGVFFHNRYIKTALRGIDTRRKSGDSSPDDNHFIPHLSVHLPHNYPIEATL